MSFFCLWIPQFAAWAVAQGDSDLSKRRFAVSENGRIISASPLAEKYGVRVGMPTQIARLWCNGLCIVPRDVGQEAVVWEEVQRIVFDMTPRVESLEPGLLLAEIDAAQMSGLVHHWGAHGGLASDRATAHLAALVAEKREIRCVRRGREESFVSRVPLDFLLDAGLAQKSLDRLYQYDYRYVGHLCALSHEQLQDQFGLEADMLFHLSRGADHEPNLSRVGHWAPPQEITAQRSLAFPAVEAKDWEEALDHLLARVCSELGPRSAQRVQIIAQTATTSVTARRFLKHPARRSRQLQPLARTALREALNSLHPLPPVVTGLEVRLGAFDTSSTPTDSCEKRAHSAKTMTLSCRWRRACKRFHSFATRWGRKFATINQECRELQSPKWDASGWLPSMKGLGSSAGLAPVNFAAINTIQGDFTPTNSSPTPLSLHKAGR
jgi:nucleotidyltransferase/DNA polymerase involved in DNA repair